MRTAILQPLRQQVTDFNLTSRNLARKASTTFQSSLNEASQARAASAASSSDATGTGSSTRSGTSYSRVRPTGLEHL